MRPPPALRPWLTLEAMASWVQAAPDKATYQRRLALSLIAREQRHVGDVARMLVVSPASVWRWIQQYNTGGPAAVVAHPRGGRRGGYLTLREEAALLKRFRPRAVRGEVLTVEDLRPAVARAVGRPVSRSYVYDLLQRHGWRKLAPRPRHVGASLETQAAFKKTTTAKSA